MANLYYVKSKDKRNADYVVSDCEETAKEAFNESYGKAGEVNLIEEDIILGDF